MDDAEALLRRLALNDEAALARALVGGYCPEGDPTLEARVHLLVRLGALLALGATVPSLRATVQDALARGATEQEVVAVLVIIAPAIGLARVVAAASRLATALGWNGDAED